MKRLAMPGLRLGLTVSFLLCLFAVLILINLSKPRIVVVHSLSQQAAWTQDLQQGLQARLSKNRLPVVVEHEFLNLDLLSSSADVDRVSDDIRQRIARHTPDVLIAVDDEANDRVARHFVARPSPQIVYTGLLMPPLHYGYGPESGIVGVRERLPLQGISDLLAHLFPGQGLRLAILGASDLTGSLEMAQALGHDWKPHRIVAHGSVYHFEEWKAFLAGPAQQAEVLIVLSTDTLRAAHDGPSMQPEADMIAWTESHASALPVGVREAYVRKGGGLALSTPAHELGASAMDLALARIGKAKDPPSTLAPESLAYDVSIRQSALDRRGLVMPSIYMQAARKGKTLMP
jgi:hypothetical protein